jgi:hypothetical protein
MGHLVQIMTLIGGFALIAAACSVSTDDQPTISSASPPADVPATSVVESPGSDTTIESPPPPPPPSTASQPSIESTNGVPKDTSMFGPVECRDGEENIELSHLIYEPDLFDVLVPMGRAWDSHVTPTDHLYVFLYEERERKMVKTPAAGRIINIESFSRTQSPFWDSSIKEPDLRVIIAHSCTLFSVFIHVGELVPKVAAVVGEIEPGGRWHAGSDTII